MDNKKICFIVCTNNDLYLGECIEYINRLIVPVGYTIDLLTITEATSMTSGYNEGMRNTDAKYKVYMHQDTFIINRHFLQDIIDIFSSDEKIGLIGMVGYPKMAESGVMWYETRVGSVPMYGAKEGYIDADFSDYRYDIKEGFTDVSVADGLLLATSRDILWDEEFDGWDFYDATQCTRFKQAGFRVVVPVQKVPWAVHDDGMYLTMWNYNKYRKKFLDKYAKKINEKKIEIIMCVNNEKMYEECMWYINKLIIPDGYELSVMPIRGAGSMVQAYDSAMHISDAKYKIYIHQDVFFVNPDYLIDLLAAFSQDSKIGMIGAIGTETMPTDAIAWNKWNRGCTYANNASWSIEIDLKNNEKRLCRSDMSMIDGMLMATQYDLPWRADLNIGWDFYDVTQSLEFLSKGYLIGVLCGDKTYTFHDCGSSKLGNYDAGREPVMREYKEYFDEFVPTTYEEEGKLFENMFQLELKCLADNDMDQLMQIDKAIAESQNVVHTNIRRMQVYLEIFRAEKQEGTEHSFIGKYDSWDKMNEVFDELKFALRRVEFLGAKDNMSAVTDVVRKYQINSAAFEIVVKHTRLSCNKYMQELGKAIFEE